MKYLTKVFACGHGNVTELLYQEVISQLNRSTLNTLARSLETVPTPILSQHIGNIYIQTTQFEFR